MRNHIRVPELTNVSIDSNVSLEEYAWRRGSDGRFASGRPAAPAVQLIELHYVADAETTTGKERAAGDETTTTDTTTTGHDDDRHDDDGGRADHDRHDDDAGTAPRPRPVALR